MSKLGTQRLVLYLAPFSVVVAIVQPVLFVHVRGVEPDNCDKNNQSALGADPKTQGPTEQTETQLAGEVGDNKTRSEPNQQQGCRYAKVSTPAQLVSVHADLALFTALRVVQFLAQPNKARTRISRTSAAASPLPFLMAFMYSPIKASKSSRL